MNEIEKIALVKGLRRLRSEKTERFEDAMKDYLDEDLSRGSMYDLIQELESIRQEYLAIDYLINARSVEELLR